jgi:basic amino acid/polyamine antiporter, APA family
MAQLQRKIGLWTATAVVAGSVIGSSIFMKPAAMAGQVGSPLVLLMVWLAAGLVSFFGAMINAEVGAMMPVTGGQYQFFKTMYGNFFAFIYGWSAFSVINTASIASIAYVFADYLEHFIHLPRLSVATEQSFHLYLPFIGNIYPLAFLGLKAVTILLVLLLTWFNYRSVKWGGSIQLMFTIVKVAALLLLIGIIFFSGKGNWHNLTQTGTNAGWGTWLKTTGFIAALSGAFASYDGWNNIGFIAGEIRNPQKNIPKALFMGLGVCVLLYVLTSEAYLYMMPVQQMQQSQLVATDAVTSILGHQGAGFIALLVMVSAFGAVNGNVLACARVSFAMGAEGNFFSRVGKVHPRFQTPGNALWLHGVWTCLFVLSGSFDMLADMFVFGTWIFYAFAAYGIFILRRKMPQAERPYKMPGYPVIPLLFIVFAVFYLVLTVYNDIQNYINGKAPVINSVFVLAIMAAGLPLYFWLKKRKERRQ